MTIKSSAAVVLLGVSFLTATVSGVTVGFEELVPDTPFAGGGAFYNGSDGAGGFVSQGVAFNNTFDDTFGSWEGWSYSTTTDTTDALFTNQYSSLPGAGAGGSATYAVAFGNGLPVISLPAGARVQSLALTNTTFAGLTIRDGNLFSDPFGGVTGDDPDLFQLTITGLVGALEVGAIDVPLADYRPSDNTGDFILDTWRTVDLTPLGEARSLRFSFTSTDVGAFGINTPLYVAVDDLVFTTVPEPGIGGFLVLAACSFLLRRRRCPDRCMR